MKTTTFSSLFILFFSIAFSQTKPTFGNLQNDVSPSLFNENESTTMVFYTIEMLGKTNWENHPSAYTINLLPKNFDWNRDARRIESYKNMDLNIRKQDINGRDLPADISSEVIHGVYSKSSIYR